MKPTENKWPLPPWLTAIEEAEEQDAAHTRFLLSLACIYYSAKGKPGSLAQAIGMTANAFSICKSRGRISPHTALAIEKALGRDLFPREVFRHDLFLL